MTQRIRPVRRDPYFQYGVFEAQIVRQGHADTRTAREHKYAFPIFTQIQLESRADHSRRQFSPDLCLPDDKWPALRVVLVMRDNCSHSRYSHSLACCYIRRPADNLQFLRTHVNVAQPQLIRRRMATYIQDLANDILVIAFPQLARTLDLQPEHRQPLG